MIGDTIHTMRYVYAFVILCFLYGTTLFAADINATITTGLFVPLQPVNIGAVVDNGSIVLSWSTPLSDGGTAILDYIIEYKLSSSGVWSVYDDGITTNTFATVSSLLNDNSYDFRISAINGMGQGPTSATVTATPGVPANVFIVSIDDVVIPNILSHIRVSNLGSTLYEYQVVWCITDSVINTCGGGNDVYSSSTSVSLAGGEIWETAVFATLSTVGQYYFHTAVDFGSDTAHTSLIFSAITETSDDEEVANRSTASIGNTCRGADFNKDGEINGIDYAVLKYFFNTERQSKSDCIDLNNDTKINAPDFSIFLIKWK